MSRLEDIESRKFRTSRCFPADNIVEKDFRYISDAKATKRKYNDESQKTLKYHSSRFTRSRVRCSVCSRGTGAPSTRKHSPNIAPLQPPTQPTLSATILS